jgi:hypothetical protein
VQRWPHVPTAANAIARSVSAAEAGRDPGRDATTHRRRPGRRHEGDPTVVDERLPHLGAAQNQPEQPAWCVGPERLRGALHELERRHRGQRRLLGRLPHHRVAAHERQHRIPRPHRDREVEGRYHAHDTERMPRLHHAMVGALGGDGQAVQLARQTDRVIADVDHLLDFAERLARDLARLGGHDLRELALRAAQRFAELAHQQAAARRGHAPPRPERVGCPLDDARDLVGRAVLQVADDLPRDGRAHRPAIGCRSAHEIEVFERRTGYRWRMKALHLRFLRDEPPGIVHGMSRRRNVL